MPTRMNQFLVVLALLACTMFPVGTSPARAADRGKKPFAGAGKEHPNIVYILADDMSYDSVSALNEKMGPLKTPFIDQLASEGMIFTDAHSGSAVCTPTRYGILTGRYCWRTDLKSQVLWEWGRPLIERGRLTVAELLQQQGYRTGMVGKWHLGMTWLDADGKVANHDVERHDSFFKKGAAAERCKAAAARIDFSKPIADGPINHGFDDYFGVDVPNFPPYIWIENDRLKGNPSVPKPDEMFGHPGPMLPGWKLEDILPTLTAKSVQWIEQRAKEDGPFFLYLPLTSPHTPIAPSEKFKGTSGISDYADFLIETDWAVGEIMAALDRAGVADDTLLIFTTDNGTSPEANFKELESHGIDLHYHFKGHKAQIHEGGHRVPFIVRWPGKVAPGSSCEETVCLNDFMATVAAITGAELPEDAAEDSYNILPLFLGEKTLPGHSWVVNHDYAGNFAIRKGRWKLVPGKPVSLFDLEADPKEANNLADQHPELVAEMAAKLEEYKRNGRSVVRRTDAGVGGTNAEIPFEAALKDADIVLSSLASGQHESLILGNGDLYGIVWERDGGLTMRVTKNDIWDARIDTSQDPPLPKVDVRNNTVSGVTKAPPSYRDRPYPQPRCAAALRVGSKRPAGGATAQRQAVLDLRRAVATVNRSGPPATTIRVLAHRNVVLIQTPEPVILEPISAETLPNAATGETDGVAWLEMKMPGDMDYPGMQYALAVASRGDWKAVSVVTSFDIQSGDVRQSAIALARQTLLEEETQLIARHQRSWHEFWSRSGVELADRDMQRWWYRLLYFARTISRPGAAPPALMPPLATDATPWHADYHFNYNSWQPFYSVVSANHPELADSWITYVHELLPRAKWLAREGFGCEGVFYSISQFLHEPNPALCKSKNRRQIHMNPWGLTIGMVGMTAQSLWHKHLCQPDRAYLEAKIYPTLREAARFYVSFMQQCRKDENGKVLLGPSYSPEHGAWGIANCPFDVAYAHYTFEAFLKASQELGKDRELAARCRAMKDLLADYPVAMDADGKPVVVDWHGCTYKQVPLQNITVPSSPVFPAEQVTWFSPQPVKDLFRRTIKDTRFSNANSHIMFNIARARLSMPEAVTAARAWFTSRELPNGLFVWESHQHGTFMPESIGVVALISEFLMQSVGDTIRIFPCWPDDKDARFSRLRAQGGFLVSAEKTDGRVQQVMIESTVGGKLRLLIPWATIKVNGIGVSLDARGVACVDTETGDRVVLTP